MSALTVPQGKMTEAEYLAFEHASAIQYEYIDGDIFAMSGASKPHHGIAFNTGAALRPQLHNRRCRGNPSDMKVRTPTRG